MFRKRRIQTALGQAAAMPPPSISMSRPLRSRDPGPSIPDAPGRCPLHQGQLGWNMLLPCEACISLAFVPAESTSANSHAAVDPSGTIQGATTGSLHAVNSHARQINSASRLVSSASLEVPSQGSGGVPPPPPPIACFRHRGGRGWSLSDPCEACLLLAFEADLDAL